MAGLVDRSTYLSSVETTDGRQWPTAQAMTESTHFVNRHGGTRKKQATRYGLHGMHEYRGKFNPQMARALINIADPSATQFLDPFCGSGTALVEGARLGLSVSGIDSSPMAHFIARTKVTFACASEPAPLFERFTALRALVRDSLKEGQDGTAHPCPHWMSPAADSYLREWFTAPAISSLYAGLARMSRPGEDAVSDLVAVAISSIVRSVSLQLPEDLRVRRRPPGFVAPSLADAFDSAADRIEAGFEEMLTWPMSGVDHVVLRGSCSDENLVGSLGADEGRRLVVTSPPYATALPYIDTDRLSLVLLGLASPKELRHQEAALVGSREWGQVEARRWSDLRSQNALGLPGSVVDLLSEISSRNELHGAGFRRAAVPALLYRYFADMAACLRAWTSYLRPSERAVLVVGRNRTGRSGDQVLIDTPRLLADVAQDCGYQLDEIVPFETWPRYGLHGANGVRGEDAIFLTRAG